MDNQLLTPLSALETSLTTLITSLTTSNTFSSAPTATRDLLSADSALSSSLLLLEKHQRNYAQILKLREEAERLQNQIKEVVRTCVDLRREVGGIAPGILDDDEESDTDGEDESVKDDGKRERKGVKISTRKTKQVDYNTLLSFAARIGKHNAVAAHEAEKESIRRKIESSNGTGQSQNSTGNQNKRSDSASRTNINNVNGSFGAGESNTQQTQETESGERQVTTMESQAELSRMNDLISSQRAIAGMGFPAAEILRMGALGRLQVLREEKGEKAVDDEIERLVGESEGFQKEDEKGEDEAENEDEEMEDVHVDDGNGGDTITPATKQPERSGPSQQQQHQQQRQSAAPARRKLDLDFPGSDDDDDDDD